MVADNVFVNFSGASLETGSRTVELTILCGISGGLAIPVLVNGAGAIQTV